MRQSASDPAVDLAFNEALALRFPCVRQYPQATAGDSLCTPVLATQ